MGAGLRASDNPDRGPPAHEFRRSAAQEGAPAVGPAPLGSAPLGMARPDAGGVDRHPAAIHRDRSGRSSIRLRRGRLRLRRSRSANATAIEHTTQTAAQTIANTTKGSMTPD